MRELALQVAAVGSKGIAARCEIALEVAETLAGQGEEFLKELVQVVNENKVWEEEGKTEEEWKKHALMDGVIEERIENYKRSHRRKIAAENVCDRAWGLDWKKRLGGL